jgi:integrase
MIISDAVATFLTIRQSEGLTSQTLDWYAIVLGQFSSWLGEREIVEVKPLDIAGWLVSQHKRGLAPITIEGSYRGLLSFFNWCERSPDVGKPPSPIGHGQNKTIRRPKVDEPDLDYVTFEEFAAVQSAIDLATWLDYRDWCMIGLMFWCGLRRGELLSMRVADVRLAKDEVRVRESKNRKPRTAYLLDDVAAGLRYYLQIRPEWHGTEMWLAYDKARSGIAGPLSTTGLRLMLARRCKRAGVRFLHPHLFRHGFAMNYLNNDAELKAVSTMLGHSTVKTTERHYAKWLDGPLREVHHRVANRIMNVE